MQSCDLRVTWQPLQEAVSWYVCVAGTAAIALELNTATRTVVRAREGTMPADSLPAGMNEADADKLARAISSSQPDPASLSHGDNILIDVRIAGKTLSYGGGVDQASASLRAAIERWLTAVKTLPVVPSAPAYIRAEQVDSERRHRLESSGRREWPLLTQFQSELQALLIRAGTETSDWHRLDEVQLAQLTRTADRGDYYLDRESLYQWTIYHSRKSEPPFGQ